MKKFFLSVLSSFTGTWLAMCLFGIVAIIVFVAIMINIGVSSSKSNSISFSENGLLVLNLDGEIIERETSEAPDFMTIANGNFTKPKSLTTIVEGIKAAKDNDKIKAMYIECGVISAELATLNEIRNAVTDFKSSGKKIYAYAEIMSQSAYYVASAADSIFMNPYGQFELMGIGGYTPYFKNLLDKFDVKFQVVKVGTYKSAVEPYILSEMSQPAKAQLDTLYGSLWNKIKYDISSSRKIQAENIDRFINRDYITTQKMNFVLENKLVDGLYYRHEMDDYLASLMGVDNASMIERVTPEELAMTTIENSNKSHIAVVYAVGGIDDGNSTGIVSKDLVPLIYSLKDNENVKGLVLRVNSPGGSAYGSEQIWEALEQFKNAGKPFVVSMGDYAASGGYYISCGADKIFADPLTITGSIGIFGLIPDMSGLLKDKLGVNFQLVSTNPEGYYPSLVKPLTAAQYSAMQRMVEDGYDLFTKRVAEGRNMTQDRVKQIGEGRVWSADKAKEIGLVDELGTLNNAIDYLAQKLSMGDDINVVKYPEVANSLWTYMTLLENENASKFVQQYGLKNYEEFLIMQVKMLIERPRIQARMADMYIKL